VANTGALGSADQRAASARPGAGAALAATAGPQPALGPYAGFTAGQLASPSWTSDVTGYLSGQAAPGLAAAGLAGSLGSAQLGMVGPQTQVSAAELQSGLGFDLAGALLGYEGTQVQGQSLASQEATAGAQQGLEQAQYGVQQTQFPEQQAEAALANQNAVINARDAAAVGGTLNTTGYKRGQATQAAEYGWQQADIFRNQQLAQLGQQSEQVGFGGQEQQFAAQRKQLELAAQAQGLSTQQAEAQFGFGLNQLGVQASPEQYLSAIAGAESTGAQGLAAVGSQAAMIGGLGPHYP
jgi:hypothetical protein